VASLGSCAPQPKRNELQQNLSEAPEELQRFFRKLAEWFPEPPDDELRRIGLSPKQHSHVR
jgi:hypothetical protein